MSDPAAQPTLDYARPGDDGCDPELLERLDKTRQRMARLAMALGWTTAVIGVVALLFLGPVFATADWPLGVLLGAWAASGVALMLIREDRRALGSEGLMLAVAIIAVINALPYAFFAAGTIVLAAAEGAWEPLVATTGAMLFVIAGSFVFVLAMRCHRLIRLRRYGTVQR